MGGKFFLLLAPEENKGSCLVSCLADSPHTLSRVDMFLHAVMPETLRGQPILVLHFSGMSLIRSFTLELLQI